MEEKGEGKEGESKQQGREGLVKKVQEFFYENEEFFGLFEDFVQRHVHQVSTEDEDGENKLVYTQLHKQYQDLMEQELTAFIEEQGATVHDFYDEIREAADRDPMDEKAIFGQIMSATADFDVFMLMMRDEARQSARRGK